MITYSELCVLFWNEDFWTGPNSTWADYKSLPDFPKPQVEDLLVLFILVPICLLVRFAVERVVAIPFANLLGLKTPARHVPEDNTILEKVYKSVSKEPDGKRVEGLAKQLDWSERQVERWFRRRRNRDRPSLLKKFKESCWRFSFYLSIFIYGVWTLHDAPWASDTSMCWRGYPLLILSDKLYWYYMIELAFYWSLTISQFFDVKRKDFWQMFVHHIATIMLLSYSWVTNFVRIGSLTLIVHDCADFFLELAKMFNYAKWEKMCNIIFLIFAIAFFATRTVVFPFWIIYSAMIESISLLAFFPAYYLFSALLLTLQVLHLFWGYLIVAMVIGMIRKKEIKVEDTRSDSEEETNGSEPDANNDYRNIENNSTNGKMITNGPSPGHK